jgi:hypothetical protein
LLDRTHIRFFGMKNIQALFEGAGLKIAEYAYFLRQPGQTELAESWKALPACARAGGVSACAGRMKTGPAAGMPPSMTC